MNTASGHWVLKAECKRDPLSYAGLRRGREQRGLILDSLNEVPGGGYEDALQVCRVRVLQLGNDLLELLLLEGSGLVGCLSNARDCLLQFFLGGKHPVGEEALAGAD
jgi:hypothetical protein